MELTKEEQDWLDNMLNSQRVVTTGVERPLVTSSTVLVDAPTLVPLGAKTTLSDAVLKRMERELEKKKRHKAAVAARASKLKRGRFHHKKKAATRKRAANKRWKEAPLKSLVYGPGNWAISQEEWDREIGWLWSIYNPLRLKVKRKWGMGTKKDPYRIWHLTVVYTNTNGSSKVVYDGPQEAIRMLSEPNALDIEKAPEGALLFC